MPDRKKKSSAFWYVILVSAVLGVLLAFIIPSIGQKIKNEEKLYLKTQPTESLSSEGKKYQIPN